LSSNTEIHNLDDTLRRVASLVTAQHIYCYINYNLLSLPFVHVVLTDTDNVEPLLHIVLNLNTLSLRKLSSIDVPIELNSIVKMVPLFRIRCSHGWIQYGSTSRSSRYGIPYTEQGFIHLTQSSSKVVSLDEDCLKTVLECVSRATALAIQYLEKDGLI